MGRSRRLTVAGACGPGCAVAFFAQSRFDVGRHAVAGRQLPAAPGPRGDARRISAPNFRRRPGQGPASGRKRPGLEIGEVGGERAQAVLADPLARQMFQGRDVVVGQEAGEASRRSIGRMAASVSSSSARRVSGSRGRAGEGSLMAWSWVPARGTTIAVWHFRLRSFARHAQV